MHSNNQWLDPLYLDSFLNEDEKLIRENTKKYCQKNLLPNVVENNRNYYFDREIYKDFGKMGFLGSTIKGFGSSEINKVSYGLIAFEIESIDSSYRSAISVQSSLVCHPIDKFGSKEQKETYLPDLIKGNLVGCFGLTESEAGSDPSSMKTNFKEFEDHYLINGSKTWITNAPIADIFLIWALNEKKDIKLFLIPKKTKGLKTSTIENKTSLKISPTGQIILDNVKIPKETLLPHTSGWKSVYACLNNARYGISWGVIGAAQSCWLIAKEYAENRIMIKKLYAKCIEWAGYKNAKTFLAIESFSESSFFPVPPDLMIVPMVVAKREDYLKMDELRGLSPSAENMLERDISGNLQHEEKQKKFSHVVIHNWELIGNYAIRFYFSDGHNTGLYSFKYLQKLGDEKRVSLEDNNQLLHE